MSVLDDLLKSNDDFASQKTQGYPSHGVQTSGDDTANEEHNIVVDYARKLQQKQPQIADDATETPAYEPGKFLRDYLKANEGFKPLTAEQQAEEKKRQDRNLLLGSIGDALSAFHTAYANARGTKPMVNPGESLTGKMRERYERLNKEREMRDKEYYSGMMRAQQMDAQQDLSWQQLKQRQRDSEAAQARYEQERQDKIAQNNIVNQLKQQDYELKQQNYELQKQIAEDKRNGVGTYAKTSGRGKGGKSSKVSSALGNTPPGRVGNGVTPPSRRN